VVFIAYRSTCISFHQASSLAAREPDCVSIISLMISWPYFISHFISSQSVFLSASIMETREPVCLSIVSFMCSQSASAFSWLAFLLASVLAFMR
jgi:hypothetical protein